MTADQIYRYLQNPEKLNQESLPQLKTLTEKYPAFETGWMLYLKNLKNLNSSVFENELILGAIRIHDRRKLYLFLNEEAKIDGSVPIIESDQIKREDVDVLKLIYPTEYRFEQEGTTDKPVGEIARAIQDDSEKKQSLIEKFLEAKPAMPPVKEPESNSPMEARTTSDPVDDDFVTETLAHIYSRQGYYKKAIHIFEKLSLKYPEKSTYFAGHIEKIKSLMNN
jgi:tetratricopeptide (TPR) repeat protein